MSASPYKANCSLDLLAGRHFWWHWLIGTGIAAGIVLIMLGARALSRNPDTMLIAVFFPFLFFGIPAAVVGLLRMPAMEWLFRKARYQPHCWPTGRLLRWTSLLFLAPVLPITCLISVWVGGKETMDMFLLYNAISIPWLVGALIATYLLRYRIWSIVA